MGGLRVESVRDQVDNPFTTILRRVFRSVPAVQAAVFVDMEGECIDCVTCLDPFDAKVSAAHMHMLLGTMRRSGVPGASGTFGFEVVAHQREVWVRCLGDEYVLVIVLARGFDRSELRDAVTLAGREFRAEVGIETPAWERDQRLSVRVRASPGWSYAPEGFSCAGKRIAIAVVLGRWDECSPEADSVVVCFRVRTLEGQELTLAHDEATDVWVMRE